MDKKLRELLAPRKRHYKGLRIPLSGGRNVCVGRSDDGGWLINVSRPGMRRKMAVSDEAMKAIFGMVLKLATGWVREVTPPVRGGEERG